MPLVVAHLETGPSAGRVGGGLTAFPRVSHHTDPIFQPEQAAICSRRGKIPNFSSRDGRLFLLANLHYFHVLASYTSETTI